MEVSKYIGKSISRAGYFDEFWEKGFFCGDSDGLDENTHTVGEVFLSDYTEEYAESVGGNMFSISVFIKDNQIVKILRICHWHEQCTGSDSILSRFSRSLEDEAESYLEKLTQSKNS